MITSCAAMMLTAIMLVPPALTTNAAELETSVSENRYEIAENNNAEDVQIADIDTINEEVPKADAAKKAAAYVWKIPLKVDYRKKKKKEFTLKYYSSKVNSIHSKEVILYFSPSTYDGEYTYATSWRARDCNKKNPKIEEHIFNFEDTKGIEDGILTVYALNENVEFDCDLLSQAFEVVYPDGEIVRPTTWDDLEQQNNSSEPDPTNEDEETVEENTLKTYLNATEPIEVEPGYWILPVDFTDVMMRVFYRVQIIHDSKFDNGQKTDWIGIRYNDFDYKYSKLSGTIVPPDVTYGDGNYIRLAYVREKIRDSLDWKRAQVVVKYDPETYKGIKPTLEAFAVRYPSAHHLLDDIECNSIYDPLNPTCSPDFRDTNFTEILRGKKKFDF